MCGENRYRVAIQAHRSGSSPRVRGKPIQDQTVCLHRGLIPACAGKTSEVCQGRWGSAAHPRVCGENGNVDHFDGDVEGSSPRVRGKLEDAHASRKRAGLIPACAGKTRQGRQMQSRRWAHPRVCGENEPGCQPSLLSAGSSPRVRGKLSLGVVARGQSGLIPACAGKTKLFPALTSIWGGSSPRVRGKPGGGGLFWG